MYQYGANVNTQNVQLLTPLHYAALNAHVESVKFLLKHEANRNLKGKSGKTALDMAESLTTKRPARLRVIDLLQICYQIRNQITIAKSQDKIALPIGFLYP